MKATNYINRLSGIKHKTKAERQEEQDRKDKRSHLETMFDNDNYHGEIL